jgi:hypothetical protein
MPQKMFKIGEYAKGGIIQVKITGKVIQVIGREWNHSNGGRKRQQTEANCPEWIRGTELSTDHNVERKLENFLTELSTSWWSDEIIKWIKTKVKFESDQPWLN